MISEAEVVYAVLADWPVCQKCGCRFEKYDVAPIVKAAARHRYWRQTVKRLCPVCMRRQVLSNWRPSLERTEMAEYLDRLGAGMPR